MRHLPLRTAVLFFPHFFFFDALRDGFNYLLLRRTEEGFHEKIRAKGYRDEGMYLSQIQVPKSHC